MPRGSRAWQHGPETTGSDDDDSDAIRGARARRGGGKARLDRDAIVAAGLELAAQPG